MLVETVKPATGGATETVMVFAEVLEPSALVAFRAILNVPPPEKTWVGFWEVLADPSPKLQAQEVGLPVEASENLTVCPTVGAPGDMVKAAAGGLPAGLTVTL